MADKERNMQTWNAIGQQTLEICRVLRGKLLDYCRREDIMKTAIVYYSMSGNTAQTAEKITAELDSDLIRIEPVKEFPSEGARKFIWGGMKAVMGNKPRLQPYVFNGGYDRVIICTPVWASNIAPPIRSFIHENRESLNGRSIAAVVCFAGGGADKALLKLKQLLGIESLEAELVLVDPKDKPTEDNEKKIKEFCEKLK